MNTLPDKPSELIRVAVRDLELCEKDPRYEICMADWHDADGVNGKCSVCFAGATLAKSLDVSPRDFVDPTHFEEITEGKLLALDRFRDGDLQDGLCCMDITCPLELGKIVEVANYAHSPEIFKADMLALAAELEKHGL